MKIFDFDYILKTSTNIHHKENIVLCQDIFANTAIDDGLHSHTFYEILYVLKGQGVEISNGTTYELKKGAISISKPDVYHAYYSTDSLTISNICLIPNNFQKKILDSINRCYLSTLSSQKEFELLYTLLAHNLETDSSINPDTYLNIILNLISSHTSAHEIINDKWNSLLIYINEHYNTVTLSQAAKICNFSSSHFCRAFKKDFSITFSNYIDNIKIDKAKYYLYTTDFSIYDIISIVGFSDYTRFFKCFKEITGMTPLQYRKTTVNIE